MAKKHKQWHCIVGYFDKIEKEQIYHIKGLCETGINVLIMVRKKDEEKSREKQVLKWKQLTNLFKEEISKEQVLLSIVPDIIKIGFCE